MMKEFVVKVGYSGCWDDVLQAIDRNAATAMETLGIKPQLNFASGTFMVYVFSNEGDAKSFIRVFGGTLTPRDERASRM